MKKYLIYILLLLFTAPYISSCSDEWTDSDKLSLLTKAEEEEPIVEDDIDISLLKFGFNLNPKAKRVTQCGRSFGYLFLCRR